MPHVVAFAITQNEISVPKKLGCVSSVLCKRHSPFGVGRIFIGVAFRGSRGLDPRLISANPAGWMRVQCGGLDASAVRPAGVDVPAEIIYMPLRWAQSA